MRQDCCTGLGSSLAILGDILPASIGANDTHLEGSCNANCIPRHLHAKPYSPSDPWRGDERVISTARGLEQVAQAERR